MPKMQISELIRQILMLSEKVHVKTQYADDAFILTSIEILLTTINDAVRLHGLAGVREVDIDIDFDGAGKGINDIDDVLGFFSRATTDKKELPPLQDVLAALGSLTGMLAGASAGRQ
jgi:hypothetical protein